MGRGTSVNALGATSRRLVPINLPTGEDWRIIKEPGRTLIIPVKWKWEWEPDERLYRSIMIDDNGRPISVGMPKFGNWGEPSFADHAEILEAELKAGKVYATEKADGSLIIRSVIDGKVHFRTRGAPGLGDFGPAVSKVVEAKYPKLLDPTWMTEHSIHLEFVSSHKRFQIVIKYREDDLRLIGGISHDSLQLLTHSETEALAAEGQLVRVPHVEIPNDPAKLMDMIRAWDTKEGVVLSCGGGQTLVKVKSDMYVKVHKLSSSMNAKNVFKICEDEQIGDQDAYKQYLLDSGSDWEIFSDSLQYVDEFHAIGRRAIDEVAAIERTITELPEMDDKQFAITYASKLPHTQKSAAFAIRHGNPQQAVDLFIKHMKIAAIEKFEAEESLVNDMSEI